MWLRKPKHQSILLLVLSLTFLIQLCISAFLTKYQSLTEIPKLNSRQFTPNDVTEYLPFDLSFPIINETVENQEIIWAEEFLNIPKWSRSYIPCNSSKSEFSCYELVRAAKKIQKYENKFEKNELKGNISVHLKKQNFADKFTMLYHAFIIAMYTNRQIFIKNDTKSLFPLPKIMQISQNISGIEIDTGYSFVCQNFSTSYDLLLTKFSWPQALYTHAEIGPFLRKHFSFHAAYFLGHYILGSSKLKGIKFEDPTTVVEYWKFNDINNILSHSHFFKMTVSMLDIDYFVYATNDWDFVQEEGAIALLDENNYYNMIKFLDAERFIFTMGSRFGYWVTALRASRLSTYINLGGYSNAIDLSFSQAGSLFPSYLNGFYEDPITLDVQGVNSYLYTCGLNSYEVKLYINYLLW